MQIFCVSAIVAEDNLILEILNVAIIRSPVCDANERCYRPKSKDS